MKSQFDLISEQTIKNLEESFDAKADEFKQLKSPLSIGIEVEVKFKYYFPEAHKKYFGDFGSYKQLEYTDKQKIQSEIAELEKPLQSKLFKTIECGIPHGLDRYWEFAFTPAYDLALICKQVSVLNKAGLIPDGKHSLHINIGDIKVTPKLYWILNILELSFCTKERIKSGFSKNHTYMSAAWAKKGDGGILTKNYNDLSDSDYGVEFRTLQFNGDANKLYEILNTLVYFLSDDRKEVISKLREEVIRIGLPDANWGKPHINPEVWNKYVDNFDKLSHFLNSIKTW